MNEVWTPSLTENLSLDEFDRDGQVDAKLRTSTFHDDNVLNDLLAETARQCGACAMLAHWHDADNAAHLLSSITLEASGGLDFAAFRDEAIVAARTKSVRLAGRRSHVVAGDECATAVLVFDEGMVTLTGISKHSGPRVDRIVETLERLLPFVTGYFEQWRTTQRMLARLQSLAEAIDCSGMATFLLGNDAQIIFANQAAETVLSQGDGLRRNGERLACTQFADTLRLQAATSHFLAEADEHSHFNPVLAVPRAKRRPLTIALTAARGAGLAIADRIHAIAYVFDPEQDMTRVVEPVCRLYGLSQSETRLTCALVAGEPLGSAAKITGVQEQTARSYLKQIFAKTETNRQAELVQLMLKSAVRLSCSRTTRAFF